MTIGVTYMLFFLGFVTRPELIRRELSSERPSGWSDWRVDEGASKACGGRGGVRLLLYDLERYVGRRVEIGQSTGGPTSVAIYLQIMTDGTFRARARKYFMGTLRVSVAVSRMYRPTRGLGVAPGCSANAQNSEEQNTYSPSS